MKSLFTKFIKTLKNHNYYSNKKLILLGVLLQLLFYFTFCFDTLKSGHISEYITGLLILVGIPMLYLTWVTISVFNWQLFNRKFYTWCFVFFTVLYFVLFTIATLLNSIGHVHHDNYFSLCALPFPFYQGLFGILFIDLGFLFILKYKKTLIAILILILVISGSTYYFITTTRENTNTVFSPEYVKSLKNCSTNGETVKDTYNGFEVSKEEFQRRKIYVDNFLKNESEPIYPDKMCELLTWEWFFELEDQDARIMYLLGTGTNSKSNITEFKSVKSSIEVAKLLNIIPEGIYKEELNELLTGVSVYKSKEFNRVVSVGYFYDKFLKLIEESSISIIFGKYDNSYDDWIVTREKIIIGKFVTGGNEKEKLILLSFTNPQLIYSDKLYQGTIEYHFDKGIGVIKDPTGEVQPDYLIFKPMSSGEVNMDDWVKFSVDFMRKLWGCEGRFCGYHMIYYENRKPYELSAPTKLIFDNGVKNLDFSNDPVDLGKPSTSNSETTE